MAYVAVAQAGDHDQHRVVVAVDQDAIDFSWLPDVSPFIHNVSRVRLKNVAKPLSTVRSSASWFMKPTISTSCDALSWITAGIRPFSFEKSMMFTIKKPRGACPAGPWLAA